jgi:hypothetical protein
MLPADDFLLLLFDDDFHSPLSWSQLVVPRDSEWSPHVQTIPFDVMATLWYFAAAMPVGLGIIMTEYLRCDGAGKFILTGTEFP